MIQLAQVDEYWNEWNDIWINGTWMQRSRGFLLESVSILLPEVIEKKETVPGRDGILDYTEAFGRPFFGQRKNCRLIFGHNGSYREWQKAVAGIAALIHGKECRIALGWDEGFYYTGRLRAAPKKEDDVVGTLTLEGDLDPYRVRTQDTRITAEVSGENTVTLPNLYRPVLPQITASSAMTAVFDGQEIALAQGSGTYAGIILGQGENSITVSGNGTVEFVYREAGL